MIRLRDKKEGGVGKRKRGAVELMEEQVGSENGQTACKSIWDCVPDPIFHPHTHRERIKHRAPICSSPNNPFWGLPWQTSG